MFYERLEALTYLAWNQAGDNITNNKLKNYYFNFNINTVKSIPDYTFACG